MGVSRRRLNVGVASDAAYDEYTAYDSEERLWILPMLTMKDIKGSERICGGDRGIMIIDAAKIFPQDHGGTCASVTDGH